MRYCPCNCCRVLFELSFIVKFQLFVRDAQMIWSKMKDLKEKQKDAYLMTHDGMQTVKKVFDQVIQI